MYLLVGVMGGCSEGAVVDIGGGGQTLRRRWWGRSSNIGRNWGDGWGGIYVGEDGDGSGRPPSSKAGVFVQPNFKTT